MKANDYNYFVDGKCYQQNEKKTIFSITRTNLDKDLEFSLDKSSMERFLYFSSNNPEIIKDKTLVVKSGAIKASFKLCDTVLAKPTADDLIDFKINVKDLKNAAKYCSPDYKKPVLTGVHITEHHITSTDSFKAYKKEYEEVIAPDINITIDKEFIGLLPNVEMVSARYNKNSIWILADDVVYIGRLIEGGYPDITKLYKFDGEVIEFDKELINKVLLFATPNDRVKFESKKITLFSQDIVEFETDVEVSGTINLNCKNFKTIIDSIEDEKISIKYTSGVRPLVVNNDYIVLPIKIEGE